MGNRICFLFLTSFLLCLSLAAEIDVPKCVAGKKDPGTGSDCTAYGYDSTWTVSSKTNGGAQYIVVDSGDDRGAVWPPPTVSVKVVQRVRIKLVNNLGPDEEVTLHFHGILQSGGYVTMDGPQGITQSPVGNLESFTYDFPVSHAGTFWIHSHATGQYPKGLRSPLIVTDASEATTLGYDFDYNVTVSDWWKNFSSTLDSYNNGACQTGVEVPPERIIVNDNSIDWGNPLTADKLSYLIPPGKKARLRFINMSAFARYYIHLNTKGVDDMTVIEIDGVLINPVFTKGIEISSGQRVSVIISGAPLVGSGNQDARKIIFVSDPKISIPNPRDGYPECTATFNKPPDYTKESLTQYAWAWIDNKDGGMNARTEPTTAEMKFSETQSDLERWTDDEDIGRPYYSKRPKLEFTNQIRSDKINTTNGERNVVIPEYAFNFNETGFEPRDRQSAWTITSDQANENFIHAILLMDSSGYGTMNVRRAGQSSDPTTRFPSPEAKRRDTSQASTAFREQHSLMQALRSDNGDGGTKRYESPGTYTRTTESQDTPWSHTIILKNADEVHWFVLRARRGDHPFHLHGHEFQILSRIPVHNDINSGWPDDFDFSTVNDRDYYQRIYDKVIYDRVPSPSNPTPKLPVRRDTLMIEKGWDYVIAIKADNPGTWAMHCHNDFHAETGMFMHLIERPADLRKQLGVWDVGQQNQGSCGSCYQPWISRSGKVSVDNTLGGEVWGPVAQVLRASMQYYGCPASCYQYHLSAISVRRRGLAQGD